MKNIGNKYFGCITISILLVFCKNKMQFSVEAWNQSNDMGYVNRKYLTNDLMENYLNPQICYDSLINLPGSPNILQNKSKHNELMYEIEIKYGMDIDPDWTRYLRIELNNDSCFVKAEILKIQG